MLPLDLLFPVVGSSLPTDHGYPLYAALARLVPEIHAEGAVLGVSTINAQYVGGGLLRIDPTRSRLRLRMPASSIPQFVGLAGKQLCILGRRIRLGVPRVRALVPAPDLRARTVAIKHAIEVEAFASAARQQLDALGIAGEIEVPVHGAGTRRGEPMRRVMRVKDVAVVCYPLVVRGLSPDQSLKLQTVGIGGRRRMGAGMFHPVGRRAEG